MMDKIGPTPIINPRMAKLAELLRKGKEFGNKARIPDIVPFLGGQGIGDLLIGEAPDEVENWVYGDYPVKIPEMSNIPQISSIRKQGVADALFLIPFAGGGGTAQAGTLPFKLRHMKKGLVNKWVEGGMRPYEDISKNIPKTMESLSKKADKLSEPEELYRLVHDDAEMKSLKSLKPGDLYSPGFPMSTARNDYSMDEISDAFANVDQMPLVIDAPSGVKIGGDFGGSGADYYQEFLVRPDATFERVNTGPAGEFRLRALTESEANLRRRLIKLREKK